MNNLSSATSVGLARQRAIHARLLRPGSGFTWLKSSEVAEQSIQDRFEQQVRLYPDRVAIKTEEQTLTYRTLDQAANCLAQAILAQRGSGPEPVALLLEHNASALVALLGVLKAGKFFVALDPSAPPARIASILGDSQASLMVTSTRLQSLAGEVEPAGCQQMNLDQLSPGPQAADPGLSRSPDSLAAIIYTSGSTGQPKGVIQSHRTLLHRFVSEANRFCFDAEDKLTMFHTLSTVAAMAHVLGGLLTGAALFPFDIRKKGVATVTDWLLQEGVTNFHSTPSLFRRWVDTLTGSEKFPQLRGIRLGGEATTPQDVALFKKHFTPGCILYVGLGGTESGTVSSYFFDQDSEVPSDRLPLGYPEEGVEVLLLDGDGQEVGFDRAGEIAVRSRYLSPGYWRKPELTQDRFRPDPQGGDARVYLTGDLGLRRPDGCLFHLGRKDYQVKIRGYRVELAEVELALHSIPDVKEAAVMAREDNLGTPRLVAYVVPGKKPGPTVTALRRALAEKLPSYMVPAAFVTLEALPLLPNGKMDRRALPPPENTRPQVETPFLAPRTPVEEELAGVWAQVLGLDQVGIDDNFLELGGDSLLAAQVISRVIRDFKVHLPLHALFAAPTVAQMAVVVAQRQANQASPEDVERLLAELEALSDEQARRIIEGEVVGPH